MLRIPSEIIFCTRSTERSDLVDKLWSLLEVASFMNIFYQSLATTSHPQWSAAWFHFAYGLGLQFLLLPNNIIDLRAYRPTKQNKHMEPYEEKPNVYVLLCGVVSMMHRKIVIEYANFLHNFWFSRENLNCSVWKKHGRQEVTKNLVAQNAVLHVNSRDEFLLVHKNFKKN